jgi:chromosome segregation ATPase
MTTKRTKNGKGFAKLKNNNGQAEKISDLEEKIAEKDEQIAKLERKLAQQEELEQTYQGISLQNQQQAIYISEIEAQRSRQRREIKQLNQSINQLQSQLAQEASHRQREIAAKDQQIETLKAQVQALQSFANIGEKQINRWHSRSIK